MMATLRCPICGKQFDPETTDAMPFCSRRCKLIDLRRWLDEEYGLPMPRDADEDEEDEWKVPDDEE